MATKKKKKAPADAVKILKCGIERDDENWLYLIDRKCNIIRMERGVAKARTEMLVETEFKREKGFMYYIDEDGDLAKAKDK